MKITLLVKNRHVDLTRMKVSHSVSHVKTGWKVSYSENVPHRQDVSSHINIPLNLIYACGILPCFLFKKLYLNFCSNREVVSTHTVLCVLFINITDIIFFNRESNLTVRNIFFNE